VERVIHDPAGDGWEAIETDMGSEQQTRIGRIQAQPTWQGLTQTASTWFEIYGEHGSECEGSRDPMATFRAPRANYGLVTAKWLMNLGALCTLPPRSLD
jgi:hypothetical protein